MACTSSRHTRAVDPAYLEELKELAERRSALDRVQWLQKQDDTRLPRTKLLADLYQYADLLLYPDTCDPEGLPIMQAALARLPTFCANPAPLQGDGEQISKYVQFFDPADGPGALAQRIAAYLENSPPYQARLQMLRRFTWESILERHLVPLVEG